MPGDPQFAANTANCIPRKEAERFTGMKHQRVSDLGKREWTMQRIAEALPRRWVHPWG